MTEAKPPTPPPGFVLYQLAIGHYVSRALFVAAKLGVSDALAKGPLTAEELAKATGTNAAALRRVVRLLASVGLFEERADGRFALLPLGDALREDAPGSSRASVMLFSGPGIQASWADLEYCVRTGEPAFRKDDPDADPFTEMAKDPEQAALFDKAMATFAPQTAAAVSAAYDFSAFKKVVDVGGGNGSLLLGILRANPALVGVVFDQPHVAERARRNVAEAGLADRCEVRGGSFFDAIPSGADAYLLKHVIHDWNDAQAAEILGRVREVVPPHGKVLIVEGVYPERIDTSLASRGAAANDVNMLVVAGGRQRSEAEFRELYAAAGFRLTRIVPSATPAASVIEGGTGVTSAARKRAPDLDATLAALADPTRRRVVELLRQRPRRAGELASASAVSAPAMSRHLRVLRTRGLVEEARDAADARARVYRLRPHALRDLGSWLAHMDEFWGDQLDAFRAHAERGRK